MRLPAHVPHWTDVRLMAEALDDDFTAYDYAFDKLFLKQFLSFGYVIDAVAGSA